MPASVTGQMPYAASPFASDYDAQQNAALRQRRMAELLMQQAMAPDEKLAPGVRQSALAPIAKMFNAYVSTKLDKEATEQEKGSAQARQDALTKLLGEAPQGTPATPGDPGTPDVPAVPATPGAYGPTPDQGVAPLATALSGGAPPATPGLKDIVAGITAPPPAAPTSPITVPQSGGSDAVPGTPSTPGQPAIPPTPQEMAAYGAKFLPLGPAASKIGEQFTDAAVKQMLPKPPPALMPVGGDIYDPVKGSWITGPSTLAKQAETAQARRDLMSSKEQDRISRENIASQANETRLQMSQDANETRRSLHALVGAMGGAGKTTDVGVDGTNGMPVVRGQDGRRYTIDSATGKATPYTGEVIPQAQHEKNVSNYMAAQTEAQMADQAAKAITDPKAADAYDWRKRAAVGLGMSPSQAGVSPEGQKALAYVGRDFAETTKRLYGSSFTDSEQKRAAGFTITGKDDAAAAALKAQNAAQFARDMASKYGGAAAAASSRRMGTAGAAPTGDDIDALIKKHT